MTEWPVKQRTEINEIPELKIKSMLATNNNPESLADRINPEKFSKWLLLKFTTARILKLYHRYKRNGLKNEAQLTPEDLERAELFWIKEAQRSFPKCLNSKQYVKLNPKLDERGIIVVGGRTERWMQAT